MKRLCIYAAIGRPADQVCGRYVPHILKELKAVADRLVVVTDVEAGHAQFAEIDKLADRMVRSPKARIRRGVDGYRLGLAAVDPAELATYDEILFVDSTCYGPIVPLAPILDDPQRLKLDFWSIGFIAKGDETLPNSKIIRLMTLNFFTVNRRVAESRAFQDFMRVGNVAGDKIRLVASRERLHRALIRAGFNWGSLIKQEQTRTTEPMLCEAAELLRDGYPIISRDVFTQDPLNADMRAIECRAVLQALRQSGSNFDEAMIWESLLPHYPLRVIQTNMDDLRILESGSAEATKRQWNLGGKVAVMAHVFYVEMLPEFLQLAGNVPCDFDFFITTSSQEHKERIDAGLASFDCGGKKEVRVVEQNRGRDMSSLFITFRDVALSGEYAWILRLHSKRTPQMPWQVSQSFKRHLTENLLHSRRFVQSFFDLLENRDYDNVGVVAPPVVHIGFGTLGHSWFGNRQMVERYARELNITVPLDERTPVAVYGTMFWFRPQALAPMFRYEWKWEDYNPEPHHTDGGLAHVQERLICYCAQQQGFRTLALMSSEQAARNYLKLEYKHQSLASHFPQHNIRDQNTLAKRVIWQHQINTYTRLLESLERNDERFRKIAPKLWQRSRGLVNVVWPLLKGLER